MTDQRMTGDRVIDQASAAAPSHRPSWRKPAGMLVILTYISAWIVIVVSQSEWIGRLPILAQAAAYLMAGIIWLAPLKPLLIWMETSSFRGAARPNGAVK